MVTFDELERSVDDLVVSAERAWSGHAGAVALEFVLPRALLNLPVHLWHKEHDSGDPHPLCLDYPIVVLARTDAVVAVAPSVASALAHIDERSLGGASSLRAAGGHRGTPSY